MILEKTKFSIMAAQKGKKNFLQKFLAFLNAYYPQNPSNQSSLLLILEDHMEDYSKIQKQGPLGIYFCLKVISKLALQ